MYNESLNKWGFPQKYKDKLELYPIKLIDEKYYSLMSKLLIYPKDTIHDKEISKASYLSFIINVLYSKEMDTYGESNLYEELIDFLEYVTRKSCKIEYEFRKEKVESILDIRYTIIFDDVKISESEFEEVKDIILEQNGVSVNYIKEYNPDLEEKLNKLNNKDDLSFEEQIFAFCDASQLSINQIKDYTYYQYKKHFERTQVRIEFEAFKPLEVSGQISLKHGEIKHWLSHLPDKGRYSDILISKQDYVKSGDIFKATQQK